jgi:hypothetical protein
MVEELVSVGDKVQGARLKAKDTRHKAQGSRLKAQSTRYKVQGTRSKLIA